MQGIGGTNLGLTKFRLRCKARDALMSVVWYIQTSNASEDMNVDICVLCKRIHVLGGWVSGERGTECRQHCSLVSFLFFSASFPLFYLALLLFSTQYSIVGPQCLTLF